MGSRRPVTAKVEEVRLNIRRRVIRQYIGVDIVEREKPTVVCAEDEYCISVAQLIQLLPEPIG